MNADAAVFTSMYSAQGGQAPGGSSEEKLQHRDFHGLYPKCQITTKPRFPIHSLIFPL